MLLFGQSTRSYYRAPGCLSKLFLSSVQGMIAQGEGWPLQNPATRGIMMKGKEPGFTLAWVGFGPGPTTYELGGTGQIASPISASVSSSARQRELDSSRRLLCR